MLLDLRSLEELQAARVSSGSKGARRSWWYTTHGVSVLHRPDERERLFTLAFVFGDDLATFAVLAAAAEQDGKQAA